jgi:alkaline phosphatase
MKRIFKYLFLSVLLIASVIPADARRNRKKADTPEVKYVFYMIGDGMGINQVIGAEQYNAGTGYGPATINFAHFPVRNFITTMSATSLVTDSAAGGTALATGVKTYNNAVGVDEDGNSVSNIVEWAKAAGYGTGIATSVGVNHATPACFTAHTSQRGNYEDIAFQYLHAPIDFAAGGGFITERNSGHDAAFFETEARGAGIKVLHGPDQFKDIESLTGRVLCLSGKAQTELPYAIDRKEDDTKLSDFVDAGIRYLDARFGDKGFFFMVEGGRIDNGGHADDAAATFMEVNDFAAAIDVVLAFMSRHPDETLIVVTADHETGGLELGAGQYEMHPDRMLAQKASMDAINAKFREAFMPRRPQGGQGQGRGQRPQGGQGQGGPGQGGRPQGGPPQGAPQQEYTPPTWDQVKDFLKENLGLWGPVEVDRRGEASMKAVYDRTFGEGGNRDSNVQNLYSSNSSMVAEAVGYLNNASGFQWSHGAHTGSPVGLYVIGRGAEAFNTLTDNTQIAPTIAGLAGYKK